MNKVYTRINWKNYPSEDTPLNEQNLNRIDGALDQVDSRLVAMDTTKVNVADLSDNVKSWTMDEETGVITIEKYSGEQVIFDLNIEKIPVNFALSNNGILTMTTDDGSTFTADIGGMIPVLTFADSSTITVSVSGTGINKTYSFSVKNGSITDAMLETDHLAAINTATAQLNATATSAQTSINNTKDSAISSVNAAITGAENTLQDYVDSAEEFKNETQTIAEALDGIGEQCTESALDSQAWAEGKRGNTDVASTDPQYHNNAKYWAEQASQAAGGGVMSFNGRSGAVTPQNGDYTAAMVGLDKVGNFKAVSTVANQGLSNAEKGNAKANIGLDKVDNTSDADKPISTAAQQALNNLSDSLTQNVQNLTSAITQVNNGLGTKLTTPNGTQGQVLGYTTDNVVGAMDAPKVGVDDNDPLYLLNGGFVATSTHFYKYDESLFPLWDSVSVTVVEQTSTNGKRIKTTIPAIIE